MNATIAAEIAQLERRIRFAEIQNMSRITIENLCQMLFDLKREAAQNEQARPIAA